MNEQRDFWLSCGHHLVDRDAAGKLLLTDELLKAYLARPELVPPPGSCEAERGLHDSLLRNPRRPVAPSQIAAIADVDARENWEIMIGWRDHLVKHRTLETAYLDIIRNNIRFPHIFMGQLTQAILRNALDGCGDVFTLRAAEMFFRPQKLLMQGGMVSAIDEETDLLLGCQPQSPLVALLGLPASTEIDMLSDSTADSYWKRSDRFDMSLDLTAGQRGMAALGEVITQWIAHLLAIDVVTEPLEELRNTPVAWYVGLDSEATRIGDRLWKGEDLDDEARNRLVGLFRLTFRNPEDKLETVRSEGIYLFAAMTAGDVLHLKPQNLVTGLPIRREEMVS
ncbi:hypothetical protein BST63_27545 [Bradyrhizobium canariense]|uniref:Uncharacterized protein n=1 Tax=Bradyrhizobium canariense TaxID=255045 RepID=A0ABX3WY86_9BRAD|nr:DUF6352 family protein [Bradyrhizobium canariense]OSJ08893.1 hypothetical protein BSR47_35910 [Bradyrhizobium canariense]OSJ24288.1 hypothetical protein BST63_27545 [Bradyrhizobium canariense]